MHREEAIEQLRNMCKQRKIKCPPLHYALTGFPECQRDVKWLSKILGEMKIEKKCAAYAISNFSMTENNHIIPLYIVKVTEGSPWSKEMDSKTLDFFRTKKSFPTTEDGTSNMFLNLREAIVGHIQELKEVTPPKPFVRDPEFDFIKSPRNKGAKPKQQKRPRSDQSQDMTKIKSPKKSLFPESDFRSSTPSAQIQTPQQSTPYPPNVQPQMFPPTTPEFPHLIKDTTPAFSPVIPTSQHTNTTLSQNPFLPTTHIDTTNIQMDIHSSPSHPIFTQPPAHLLHMQHVAHLPQHSIINSNAPSLSVHTNLQQQQANGHMQPRVPMPQHSIINNSAPIPPLHTNQQQQQAHGMPPHSGYYI